MNFNHDGKEPKRRVRTRSTRNSYSDNTMHTVESVSHVVHLYLDRKGSNCSTPISATVRSEYDYPSTNFVRTPRSELANMVAQKNQALASGMGLSSQMSLEEGARLQIRLHYNPVMDEWVRYDERTFFSFQNIGNDSK